MPRPLSATCSLDHATESAWDVLVVGAGPAGALAARQLSHSGLNTLLVDKARFPRRKVCGCYLNRSGLATLGAVGLGTMSDRLGAPRVSKIRLGSNHRLAELQLPPGAALSREAFDSALVEEAIIAGAHFLPEVEAKFEDIDERRCEVELLAANQLHKIHCKIVVAADGVSGQLLRGRDDVQYRTTSDSLLGAATITEQLPADYESGTIHMAVGKTGYVGALQVEDGRLDIAAAFDAQALRASGPGHLAEQICGQSGLPSIPGLASLRWLGTPPLSRRPSKTFGERVFLIGDAAGYVEPFTGEGMSWALATGRAVAPIVKRAVVDYTPALGEEWAKCHRALLGRRQRICQWLTRGLRRPTLATWGVAALARFPSVADPLISWLNQAPNVNERYV